MTIIAKYAATCAHCRRAIAPGEKIEWTKGTPVRHATCGAASVGPAAPVTRAPRRSSRGTWTGCSCGSVEEYERVSDCRTCQHDRD